LFPAALLVLEDLQFCGPVRQCPAQALEVWIASPNLSFDFRNIPAATLDSRSLLNALPRDLRERTPIIVQNGLLAGVLFPAMHNAVGVFWINFYEPRFAAPPLTGDQRGGGATEQICD
jgi:hypothetical protein